MSVLVEAGYAFRGQAASERKYEIVVRKLSFDLAMRDRDVSFEWIDAGNFGFDEVDTAIQQCLSQVERNVGHFRLSESEPHQCRIENKLPAPRNECDLMFIAELFSETLRGYHACEPTTQNQNLCHH